MTKPITERLFTTEEAQKALPLIRKIVADILSEGAALRTFAADYAGNPREDEYVQQKIKLIQSFIDELNEIGCFYKDWSFTIGLVDFPAVIDGEEVFLCWRSDEEEITHYHSRTEGFSTRKPIPEIF